MHRGMLVVGAVVVLVMPIAAGASAAQTKVADTEQQCVANPGYDIRLQATGVNSGITAEEHTVEVVAIATGENEPAAGEITVTGNGQILKEQCVEPGIDGVANFSVTVSRELGDEVELEANGQNLENVKFSDPLSPVIGVAEYENYRPGETATLELSVQSYADRPVERTYIITGPTGNTSVDVRVPAGENIEKKFTVQLPDEGGEAVYTLSANSDSTAQVMVETPTDSPDPTTGVGDGFSISAALLAIGTMFVLRTHRRN